MQARRSSLYVKLVGSYLPDTILFYDDFTINNIQGSPLTSRTPVGTNAVVGTSYAKTAASPHDNQTNGIDSVRAYPSGTTRTYTTTELLPASGSEWGTQYHAVEAVLQENKWPVLSMLGLRCSVDGTSTGNPTTNDGVIAWAYNTKTHTEVRVRVRNNGTIVYPLTTAHNVTGHPDVRVRLESELTGDKVHFAVIINNILKKEATVAFGTAKNNTRVLLGNRIEAGYSNGALVRYAIQVDTNRNFLP